MWNPGSIADMMSDNLDVTEAVVLDHIPAILHVGQQSAGEGLTQEELRLVPTILVLVRTSNGGTWLLNASSKP